MVSEYFGPIRENRSLAILALLGVLAVALAATNPVGATWYLTGSGAATGGVAGGIGTVGGGTTGGLAAAGASTSAVAAAGVVSGGALIVGAA